MSTAIEGSGGVVHEVRWSDALPWWLLFRAAGSAFSPTVIVLAALGAAATWAGWSAAGKLGLPGGVPAANVLVSADEGDALVLPGAALPPAGDAVLRPSRAVLPGLGPRLPRPLAQVAALVATPFSPTATWRQAGGALARIGWFLLVWSIFGTGIARHVALRLAGEEAPGPLGATWFGSRNWVAAFNSVVFVLAGIVVLGAPGMLLGLAMRTSWGLALAGILWPLVLLGAVVLAILAIGLVLGWPLMVAAVGVERGDAFQAISTAFSYVYQRPLHYAFYALVALVVAVPAIAAAGLFADATATLAMWAASFGMGHARTADVLAALAADDAGSAGWGIGALAFWSRGLAALVGSFGWGAFWALATAAYLVLRRDVDGTELDEVVLDEPGAESA